MKVIAFQPEDVNEDKITFLVLGLGGEVLRKEVFDLGRSGGAEILDEIEEVVEDYVQCRLRDRVWKKRGGLRSWFSSR